MKTKILLIFALFLMLTGFYGEDRIVEQRGVNLQERVDEGVIPSFTRKPSAFSNSDGSELIIKAEFKADPRPAVTWRRGPQSINEDERCNVILTADGEGCYIAMLIIKDPTEEDGGEYRVYVKKKYGESTAKVEVSFNKE